eukprot:TRINITY_DN6861_c0_g1_i1.p1 TRINITY_DN6861_c0_g1~~TRINITY_DN6861_c0_g1_i1.p1  ORF type:complete len:650 (+),score=120.61 TRINITY_DN6861_c0_g1_i1:61-2010(+)
MPAYLDQSVEYHCPKYDIYGHHHSSRPHKDQTHILQKHAAGEIRHPKWLDKPPEIKSRSELFQARKQGRIPDASYDFDGDGVVGQLDYFVGKCFDSNADGRLTTGERRRADQALENGFLDKYVRGLDSTGQAMRGCVVKQRRGVITAADNTDAVGATYPPHYNAHKVPVHSTHTALDLHRRAEAKGEGLKAGERWIANSRPVLERQPPNHETEPRRCPFSHISERAEADHQLARTRGGLLPMNQPCNPERELKTVGLERVENPLFKTRGQLLETRKEAMKRECEDLREKGDEFCVPLSVRKAEMEALEFEFRRPKEEPMTLTRMKEQRRQDKIEHDMANFGFQRVAPREYPKFSDHPDIPFWVSDPNTARIGQKDEPPRVIARTVSEPAFKVTDVPWDDKRRDTMESYPVSAHDLAAAGKVSGNKPGARGSKTVKRWSADIIERGQFRNQPRLFDSIQPVRIGPKDLESLDYTSSMEPIRTNALRARAELRKQNANQPRRSQLWSDSTEVLAPTGNEPSGPSLSKMVGASVESADALATASMQRSMEPSASLLGGSRPGVRRPLVTAVMSSEMPRPPPGMIPDMVDAREPRTFGKTTANAAFGMSQSASGVRSGGFQKMDMTQVQKPALKHSRSQPSKDRPKAKEEPSQ